MYYFFQMSAHYLELWALVVVVSSNGIMIVPRILVMNLTMVVVKETETGSTVYKIAKQGVGGIFP